MIETMTTNAAAENQSARTGKQTGKQRGGFQPELQGLRAIAVGLVVLFHLWPEQISGGFVGVDVFFVISGYLITSHIYREVSTSGTLSLRRFWARRIRRLLPASLLVLAVSAIATVLFLPATLWTMTARQIAASAAYVQNWLLAGDAVDYMAQDNVPTVAQHYWSLSVEEQFYIGWPILVLALTLLATRTAGRERVRLFLVGGLAVVGAASLIWSIVATADDQARAYFVTPTRVWEFAAGGLVAVLATVGKRRAVAHWLLGGLGLAGIVVAGILYDGASRFPGWIALLPVLGTVAVILAGSTTGRLSPGWWLSRRPMTFIGDISYSVYLWHWPLVIVVPFVTGVELRVVDKLGILAATIVLAWASKVWVEDPMRNRPFLTAMPSRSFAFASVGMAVVVAATVVIHDEVEQRSEEASATAASAVVELYDEAETSGETCVGPAALEPEGGCSSVVGDGALISPPEVVVQQNARPDYPDCQQTITNATVLTCDLGSEAANPDRVVAIVGDSHATHWYGALDRLGQERNWRVITYAKASCPATTARRLLPQEQGDQASDSCLAWLGQVRQEIAQNDEISYVFTSAFSSAYTFDEADEQLDDPATDGFQSVWAGWADAGKEIFVLRDVPPTQGDNVPNCLAMHLSDPTRCATDVGDLPDDALAIAATEADNPRVHLLDLTDRFCDDTTCYPVVGDVIVYRDFSHLSREYSMALAPYVGAEVDAAESAR